MQSSRESSCGPDSFSLRLTGTASQLRMRSCFWASHCGYRRILAMWKMSSLHSVSFLSLFVSLLDTRHDQYLISLLITLSTAKLWLCYNCSCLLLLAKNRGIFSKQHFWSPLSHIPLFLPWTLWKDPVLPKNSSPACISVKWAVSFTESWQN